MPATSYASILVLPVIKRVHHIVFPAIKVISSRRITNVRLRIVQVGAHFALASFICCRVSVRVVIYKIVYIAMLMKKNR